MAKWVMKHQLLNAETSFIPVLLADVQVTKFHPGFLISHETVNINYKSS